MLDHKGQCGCLHNVTRQAGKASYRSCWRNEVGKAYWKIRSTVYLKFLLYLTACLAYASVLFYNKATRWWAYEEEKEHGNPHSLCIDFSGGLRFRYVCNLLVIGRGRTEDVYKRQVHIWRNTGEKEAHVPETGSDMTWEAVSYTHLVIPWSWIS